MDELDVINRFYDLMRSRGYECHAAITDTELTLTIEMLSGVDLKFDFDANDKLVNVRED